MNPIIIQYFDSFEECLLQSPVVTSYKIIRQEITPSDGKFRIKLHYRTLLRTEETKLNRRIHFFSMIEQIF